MTNLPNGFTANGSQLNPATNYKVVVDPTNATPVQVTGAVNISGAMRSASVAITNAVNSGSAAITNLTNTGTLKVGGGDTINSIISYTSAAINVAAANVAATSYQVLALTVTGITNTDTLLSVDPVNAVANQFISGKTITAANTVQIALYSAINVNAATNQTFKVTVKR